MNLSHLSPLQLALGVSIAAHAALLSVHVAAPGALERVFKDSPLEIVLVNARGGQAPDKAQALGQTALAGGGDADRGRASSPLPPSALTDNGNAQEQASDSRLQQLQEQQNLLLAQVRQQLAALPPTQARDTATHAEQLQREEKQRQLLKLLAAIERRINTENARPKKRYVSPAVAEVAYAAYYDNLRRRIEDRGTLDFPTAAGRKLYGELTMLITVNHDGRVLGTEIVEGSGNTLLDRRAASIARSAGPFGTFTATMRRDMDQMVVVSRFKFTRDETLEAKVSAGS